MAIKMSKAIEVLDLNIKEAGKKMPPDVKDSLALSVSLMKAVQYVRKGGNWEPHALLPGEAPEEEG